MIRKGQMLARTKRSSATKSFELIQETNHAIKSAHLSGSSPHCVLVRSSREGRKTSLCFHKNETRGSISSTARAGAFIQCCAVVAFVTSASVQICSPCLLALWECISQPAWHCLEQLLVDQQLFRDTPLQQTVKEVPIRLQWRFQYRYVNGAPFSLFLAYVMIKQGNTGLSQINMSASIEWIISVNADAQINRNSWTQSVLRYCCHEIRGWHGVRMYFAVTRDTHNHNRVSKLLHLRDAKNITFVHSRTLCAVYDHVCTFSHAYIFGGQCLLT